LQIFFPALQIYCGGRFRNRFAIGRSRYQLLVTLVQQLHHTRIQIDLQWHASTSFAWERHDLFRSHSEGDSGSGDVSGIDLIFDAIN
jgi:hypothetical protein